MKNHLRLSALLLCVILFRSAVGASAAETLDTLVSTGLKEPFGAAVDANNNYYVADSGNNRIFKYIPDTGVKTNFAGVGGLAGRGFADGPSFSAKFFDPQGMVLARGGLVVADSGNHRIRFVTLDGVVSTLAGTGSAGSDDGPGVSATFFFPTGVAADAAGNIYVADLSNNSIRRIALDNSVTTVAIGLIRPTGITVGEGVIYVADTGSHSVKVFPEPTLPIGSPVVASVFAGSGSPFLSGFQDSLFADSARFSNPRGVLYVGGPSKLLLVADSGNNALRRVYTNTVTSSMSVDTQLGAAAGLSQPVGLARDINADTLIVGLGDNTLKRLTANAAQKPVSNPIIGIVNAAVDEITGRNILSLTPITSSTFNNDVTVAISYESGTEAFYTLNGSDPSPTNGSTPPAFDPSDTNLPTSILDQNQASATNDVTIKVIGVASGRRSSEIVSARFQFQVANPSIGGNNPGAVTMDCATANSVIYYTTDGSDPTVASKLYTLGSTVDIVQGINDVVLKVRAFRNGYAPSRIVSQTFKFNNLQTSSIGVTHDFFAGIGSSIVVPVEVVLNTNDVLRSLQFRFEVTPVGAAKSLPVSPANLVIDPLIDFIPIPAPTTNYAAITQVPYTIGSSMGLLIGYIGTNSALVVNNSSIVAMVQVSMPFNAAEGDVYKLSIQFPSGTSDGFEQSVVLKPLADRTITVSNISYVVGDTAKIKWYNAGDFGNGNLNNSDVNNAFYASMDIRKPYARTDLFNAMEAYKVDDDIDLLDLEVIFRRSLRVDSGNVKRAWSPGGFLTTSSATLNDAPNLSAEALAPAAAWVTQGSFSAGIVENANPGDFIQVPVSINVKPGENVTGLKFRATVLNSAGRPALLDNVEFRAAANVPPPSLYAPLPSSVACSWMLDSFSPALVGEKQLGTLEFTLPASAVKGDSYVIRFSRVGASHSNADGTFAEYHFETRPGAVWVGVPAQRPPDALSDEWKIRFFGGLNNPLANPFADPDGDGKNNLQEFLAGSNPAKLRFHNLDSDWRRLSGRSFKLRWFAATGKTYTIESSTDMVNWTVVATISGVGDLKEFVDSQKPDSAKFYRVREGQ